MRSARAAVTEILDNPILIGTLTILVVAVAVFLSYIAENGLPFVPSYQVKLDVHDAAELIKSADVRIGGARVGQVLKITPEPAGTDPGYRHPFARLTLSLEQSLEPLPYDTTYTIRLASVLGGKYVELFPGHDRNAARTPALPDGGTFRLGGRVLHDIPIVDVDQAFNTFGPQTQRGLRAVTYELGNALAGRGSQLNDSIYQLRRLIGPLENLFGLLASPGTHLSRFLSGAAATAGALAPVAPTVSALLANGASTFHALNSAPVGTVIDQLPGTESRASGVLTETRPVLALAAAVAKELRPGVALLPTAAARLDRIILAATPTYRAAPELASRLQTALVAVQRLAANPASIETFTVLGDNDLATLSASAFMGLGAVLEAAGPAQLACNIEGTWANNFGGPNNGLADGDAVGSWLRTALVLDGSTLLQSSKPAADLHLNYYPSESPGACTAGNENYLPGQDIGPPASYTSRVSKTSPPPGVIERYREAGLLGTYR